MKKTISDTEYLEEILKDEWMKEYSIVPRSIIGLVITKIKRLRFLINKSEFEGDDNNKINNKIIDTIQTLGDNKLKILQLASEMHELITESQLLLKDIFTVEEIKKWKR